VPEVASKFVGTRANGFLATRTQEDAERLIAYTVEAERLGFDAMFVGDRMLAQARGAYLSGHFDPLILLAAMASRTSSIRLGVIVLVVPFRHPVALAKSLASIDVISGGRLILGAGGGWNEDEFNVFGIPRSERGRRLESSLSVMRRLWTEDGVTASGPGFDIRDVAIGPKPLQAGGPPVWLASFTPEAPQLYGRTDTEFPAGILRSLDRVGRLADAWVPVVYTSSGAKNMHPEVLARAWEVIQGSAGRAGRNVQFIYSHWFHIVESRQDEEDLREAVEGFFANGYEKALTTYLIGTPDAILEKIAWQTRDIGTPDGYVFTPISSFKGDQLARLTNTVLPKLR
jgi:probable F420-dependent oxidoreductase